MIILQSLNTDVYRELLKTKTTISLASFGTIKCEKSSAQLSNQVNALDIHRMGSEEGGTLKAQ